MYRDNARLVSREIDSEGNYTEKFEYRNQPYWVYPDMEMPVELQHKYEQDFIDYYIMKDEEEQLHEFLEEIYPEDFC